MAVFFPIALFRFLAMRIQGLVARFGIRDRSQMGQDWRTGQGSSKGVVRKFYTLSLAALTGIEIVGRG
jgi:hypothetical protein